MAPLAVSAMLVVVIIKRPCGIRPDNKFLVYGSSAGYPPGGSAYRRTKMTVSCTARFSAFMHDARRRTRARLLACSLTRLSACLPASLSIPARASFSPPRRAGTPARSPFHLEAWCARYRAPAGAITTPPGKM